MLTPINKIPCVELYPDSRFRQLSLTCIDPDIEMAITAVSVGELVHGATKSQRAVDNMARMDVLLAVRSFFNLPPISCYNLLIVVR